MLIRLAALLVASLTLTALNAPVVAATSNAGNHAPTITGTRPEQILLAGQAFRLQPLAKDADGNALTFSITNKPVWASFNTHTGVLSGTPNAKQLGFYKGITICVSDGKAVTPLRPFLLNVKPAAKNHAPRIYGRAPWSSTVGQMYRFQPTATDADGDKVSFTIANKPVWASFDSRTGLLSGTPNAKQVGHYKDIEIAATDGDEVSPLSTFSIKVQAAAGTTNTTSPNVALDWMPPTENVNGSALTNLKGYTLHYGQQSKAYTHTIKIDNPSVLNYVIEGLQKGTYFFAVTAFNTKGAESEYSTELTKTVN
jgi:Putative Ig domain